MSPTDASPSATFASDTGWNGILVVVAAGVVASLQIGKVAIAAPLIQHDLQLSLTAVGWLSAVIALLGALGGVAAGGIVAAIGDRRVLTAGLVAAALGAAGGAMANGYSMLLASRIAEGFGFLLVTIAGPAVLQRIAPVERRNIAIALWSCFMPTGMALAMLTAPLFADWRMVWWCSAGLAVLAIAMVLTVVPATRARAQPSWRRLGQDVTATCRGNGPLVLAATFALYSLMFFALFSFLPVLLMDRMGVSLRTAGLLSAVATSANIVGNIAAGLLLSRGAPRAMLAGSASLIMTLAGLGIFVPVFANTPTFLLCVLFSAIGGLLPATLLATAPVVAPADRLTPVVLGLVMQGSNLGQVIGPIAIGRTIDAFGWPAAAAIVGIAGFVGTLLSLRLRRVNASRATGA
ncbi:CynX/NimT family MFS transporter [Bradyrhizobium prioriisuperbiae]|uniref:MFS transporter n=1 Tax=Bradyrhizobium prioriisuperbiae TaxID=2854389 RepID=UPI0028E301A7|nr:MFS transporter [Bradyrhizobium prioritasuperba]